MWRVLKAAVTKLAGPVYTRAQIDAWIADENPQRSAPGRTVFVAESDRRIIGFSRYHGAEIEALYVHPDQAGRKVGDLLLSAIEKSAAAREIETLYLDATVNAVHFYRSAGYTVIGNSMPVFDNGVALPCVRMQKTLQTESRQVTALWGHQSTPLAPASTSEAPSS